MPERIQFVDENDQPIGAGTREDAWRTATPVRVVRVILRDEHGRFLCQHRSKTKKFHPNRWTDSASGHVDEGESYDEAALREMKEEIGVTTDLKYVGKFFTKEDVGEKLVREFHTVYEGTIPSTTELFMEPGEVDDIQWFEPEKLKMMIATEPDNFTLGMREIMSRYYS